MSRLAALIAILSLSIALPALAQDAQKFGKSKAAIAQKVAPLQVFESNGKIVDDEVIISFNDSTQQYQAVYVVQVPVEKVVAFYKEKMALAPQKKGTEALGDVVYVFHPAVQATDTHVHQVTLTPLADSQKTQIALMKRAARDEDKPF